MQGKIYKARFFNKDSGVEITLDEAQSISETGKPIKILFHFIHSELMLIEGVVKGNTFTTLDGYSLLIKTEDNHLDLKNQEYDGPFDFGYASEYKGEHLLNSYSDFPSFNRRLQDLKEKNEISEYRFLISGIYEGMTKYNTLVLVPISFEMPNIEGNVITNKENYKFKVIGQTRFSFREN